MKGQDFTGWSDAEIVRYFHDAAVKRAKCGFNAVAANRISDNELIPAYKALEARGPEALRQLLELTGDANPNVRVDAASLAYDVDPVRCRAILQKLREDSGVVSVFALVALLHKDPDFAVQFSRAAKQRYREAIAQRAASHQEPGSD